MERSTFLALSVLAIAAAGFGAAGVVPIPTDPAGLITRNEETKATAAHKFHCEAPAVHEQAALLLKGYLFGVLAIAVQVQAQQARDELRQVIGFSVADEITKLDQLKKSGSINDVEYGRLRAKLV
jgi:hypothetical protein